MARGMDNFNLSSAKVENTAVINRNEFRIIYLSLIELSLRDSTLLLSTFGHLPWFAVLFCIFQIERMYIDLFKLVIGA